MPDTIFGGPTPAPTPSGDQPQVQSAEEYLPLIVDTDGRQKYDSVHKAFEGLANANSYIPQLKNQLSEKDAIIAEYERKLAGVDSVDEVVRKLSEGREPTTQEPQVEPVPTVQGLDAKAAADLFESMLSEREAKSAREQNQNAVIKALQEKFGDKAEEVYRTQADALDMTLEELNSLSGTSPKAVLQTFGTAAPTTSLDVSVGSVNLGGQDTPQEVEWGNHGDSVLAGATTRDVRHEARRVKNLVEQVHAQGQTIEDMTDPKIYFETFGKRKK
jgi:hypothetical protein